MARGNIVHTVAMFTADSVPGPLNKPVVSWKIRAWRRRGLIFGARYKGRDYFPAFQFRLGEPKPIVQQFLDLDKPSDDWHAMFWFVGTNVWLDEDASPYEVHTRSELVFGKEWRSLPHHIEHRSSLGQP